MFIGLSKNIGGGFRIGLGTKIGKSGSKDTKNSKGEFASFVQKVENDMNNLLIIFLESNGQSFKKLQKSKEDLDVVFAGNSDYKEFTSIYFSAQKEIEKILYREDTTSSAKKAITEAVFTVKDFINKKYPNAKQKIDTTRSKSIKKLLLLAVILFVIFSLIAGKSEQANRVENIKIDQKTINN